MINLVAHNSPVTSLTPTTYPHRTDHYVKEYRIIIMLRLCHRGQIQKLNLYETFDLTSASCDTSQRPFTQACSKGSIRNLESFL